MVSQAATAVTTFLFNRIMMKLLGENGVAAITIIIYTQFLLSAYHIANARTKCRPLNAHVKRHHKNIVQ